MVQCTWTVISISGTVLELRPMFMMRLAESALRHAHTQQDEFVYVLEGWVDLEFEDGQKLRIQQGESLYIPGGLRHNETAASRDLELLEISVPADMGTVACDPPDGWSKSA